jgi:hypothetical protein
MRIPPCQRANFSYADFMPLEHHRFNRFTKGWFAGNSSQQNKQG